MNDLRRTTSAKFQRRSHLGSEYMNSSTLPPAEESGVSDAIIDDIGRTTNSENVTGRTKSTEAHPK